MLMPDPHPPARIAYVTTWRYSFVVRHQGRVWYCVQAKKRRCKEIAL